MRLLILGGEACPPELGARLARRGPRGVEHLRPDRGDRRRLRRPARPATGRCGSGCRWTAGTSRSSTPTGDPVAPGEAGELIIGGVGLARYLDPEQGRREVRRRCRRSAGTAAYRSGDLVVATTRTGCVFVGRADDQVKLGGRRIELGEVDSALLALPGVDGAAAAVRRTAAGNQLLVGYVTADDRFDATAATRAAAREAAGRAGAAAGRGRRPPDPHLGQDRPRRAALAAAAPTGRRRRGRPS